MIESGNWSRWLGRLSKGFVATTGLRAMPQAQLLDASGAQPLPIPGRPVHLSGDEVIRVRHAGALEVRALSGYAWVTQDGDLRDIVLRAGESFHFDRDGPALIAPFGSAQVVLASAP